MGWGVGRFRTTLDRPNPLILSFSPISAFTRVLDALWGRRDAALPPANSLHAATASFKSEKLAELRKLRARRAKTVRRVAVVAVADRHGAEQHLLRRHGDEFADDAVHAGPGFLRAGIEAVAAGKKRQRVDVAAEIGPLARTELAVDGDEQRDRRVEEFEIALVLLEPPLGIVAGDAERAVELHAVLLAARLVRLPHGFGVDRIFGIVMARVAAGDMGGDLLLERRKRRAGERIDQPGLQIAAGRGAGGAHDEIA